MTRKRIVSSLLSALCIAGILGSVYAGAETPTGRAAAPSAGSSAKKSYTIYRQDNAGFAAGAADIVLPAADAVSAAGEPTYKDRYLGSAAPVLLLGDTDAARWTFTVPADGLYTIIVRYSAVEGTAGSMEQRLLLDGAVPFKECNAISYKRTWEDATAIRTDLGGNDLKPSAKEVYRWANNAISDPSGYVQDAFRFAFTKGEHTLTLEGQSSAVAIESVTLAVPEEVKTYAQVQQEYTAKGYGSGTAPEVPYIEAEKCLYKSDVTIYPISDRTSPATYPQSADTIRLNTIGGAKWKQAGQWITWEINVPKDGLYKIAPRFKQSLADGIYVSRRLLIDGELPFAEAQNIQFAYDSKWQLKALGDENGDFSFYLPAGRHTVTLEVCLGNVGQYLGEIEASLTVLNEVYRSILMITGTVPDTERDYGFEKMIPDDIARLQAEYERLTAVVNAIVAESGRGNYVSLLNKLTFQLKNMAEKPRSIAKNLDQFKSNLGSLATWLLTAREQPLELDRLYLLAPEDALPKADQNAFQKLFFGAQCFVSSFFNDYNTLGQSAEIEGDKEINVWIQTGRDQAQIMRQLIDNSFSSQSGIKVNLKLVAGGSLLPSVLAKIGPDVALNNGQGDPINYAIRNANIELSKFPDFAEVAERFYSSALAPYTFNGKTYALPETMTFPMFFYRIDIFEELGLKVPETWDEMMALIPALQRRNMSMAFPTGLTGYSLMLFQNGGELYAGEGERSNLTSDVALDSFQEFTDLFTLWRLPVEYDFPNRFRTGEMPCGIQDYSLYNNLTAFAPEIKGLWNFIPVPGKPDADGNIQHLSVAGGTNVMMMRDCADEQSAWEFLKWWTGSEAQSLFGVEMESALGAAAKQPTANREALMKMSWTSKEAKNIADQLACVQAVPEVPGGYFTSRVIDFAFNKTYNSMANPVEIIGDYIDELNDELKRKRAEFGLNG